MANVSAAPKAPEIPAMKDRSNIAALVLVLEAIITTTVKSHTQDMKPADRDAFRADVESSLKTICDEVVAQAPVTGKGVALAPSAAKRAAARIQEEAHGLLGDYLGDFFPASK